MAREGEDSLSRTREALAEEMAGRVQALPPYADFFSAA